MRRLRPQKRRRDARRDRYRRVTPTFALHLSSGYSPQRQSQHQRAALESIQVSRRSGTWQGGPTESTALHRASPTMPLADTPAPQHPRHRMAGALLHVLAPESRQLHLNEGDGTSRQPAIDSRRFSLYPCHISANRTHNRHVHSPYHPIFAMTSIKSRS